ncbi:patatin-like phospholipase family protein [Rhodococcus triatomae]|uniref:NTE family protein n=1 Tax=Rhodococcus triatomae TaxID=300028 RepID=A0A1G8MDB1_9NOCA|nr:patatin-like phospholipase family protein [Rhodococcus triatomae]QNG18128.1 patatin-like phospholipase family protein [Rhodococcus triatomae]QNG22202.1 patatin-like phospholipase family protein [Rhodococcus triatomae]SDI65884.1 NTE family protein [Rhodococcus triatomae]
MTTAFVLSGGASLGAVQVGMLEALWERDVRPDLIVGTSVGALNGAWLAGGYDAQGLARLAGIWRGLRRSRVFRPAPLTGLGGFLGLRDHLVSDRGLRALIRNHLAFDRLEDAPIPLHVIAVDILEGADVRLSQGPAEDAIVASASIPGLLPPVRIDGRSLVDGGVVDNSPIAHAVELGADRVWVLPTGYPCSLDVLPRGALGMALAGATLAINQRLALDVERYSSRVDLRVLPPLCPLGTSPADFRHADDLITRGRAESARWLDETHPPGHSESDPAELLAPHGHS